ncbi:MAG TPA: phasin family protein [Hyphomicrobiaceae bacterium]|jgi:hypothetical protein|nr:phasin family protein [Hyphomicrobiaceae bacterium]
MPDKTTNGRADAGLPPMMLPFGFDALMELNRPALQAMAQVNGKMYDGIATWNRNWVNFLNRRLKEDMAVPQQLAACKTMQDMYGVYAEFFQNACAQYQSEFEQMAKLSKSLASDTMQVMQAHADDAREGRVNN